MIKRPEAIAPAANQPPANETAEQRFERILLRPQFKPLKAVLDNLGIDDAAMRGALSTTTSYPDFLSKLGYRLVQVEQLHEQDCYSRLGQKGGIRAVLPHHDTTSYNTFVTLVNFDSTLTTTPNAVVFFSARLAELKTQVMN